MNVVIFGATGMVGSGVLRECLDDPRVQSILVVGRVSIGPAHPKVRETLISEFFDYTAMQSQFTDRDACFFCLGVSAIGMGEDDYRRMTYDLTTAAARSMVGANPRMTFCYVSGQHTDSTERGRAMWARVKGRTENAILGMGFRAAYMFRPGFIQPLRGVKSKTRLYQVILTVFGPVIPVLRAIAPGHITTTVDVGRAMIEVAANGYTSPIIEMPDIARLAVASRSHAIQHA